MKSAFATSTLSSSRVAVTAAATDDGSDDDEAAAVAGGGGRAGGVALAAVVAVAAVVAAVAFDVDLAVLTFAAASQRLRSTASPEISCASLLESNPRAVGRLDERNKKKDVGKRGRVCFCLWS